MTGKLRSLKWQWFLTLFLVATAALAAITVFTANSFKTFYEAELNHTLLERARLIGKEIQPMLEADQIKEIQTTIQSAGQLMQTRITVLRSTGEVVADSEAAPQTLDNHLNRSEIQSALHHMWGTSMRQSKSTGGTPLLYLAIPLRHGEEVMGFVRVAVKVAHITHILKAFYIKIVGAGAVMVALAGVLSWLMAARLSKPLCKLESVAHEIAEGNFQVEVPEFQATEFEGISKALNTMVAQLESRIRTITAERHEKELILTQMIEGVVALDANGRITTCNQSAGELLKCDPAEVIGKSFKGIFKWTELVRFTLSVLKASAQEPHILILNKDDKWWEVQGRSLQAAVSGSKYSDAVFSAAPGALMVIYDITRLRKLENMRREFVANVSHELRTPITLIKGFLEMLGEGDEYSPEQKEEFIRIINKNVDRLTHIVDDLLSLAKVERDQEQNHLEVQETSIRSLMEEVVELCALKAGQKQIKIRLEGHPEIRAEVNSSLISQAILNMVDNAIKYSDPQKEIELKVSETDTEIKIQVKDQGLGIEAEKLPHVFERFYRADKSRSAKEGGTGLGLAIVKNIAIAHGGRVEAESEPKVGSRFTILLPKHPLSS